MFPITTITNLILFPASIICILALLRLVLYRTALILVLKKLFRLIEDRIHVHQLFKVHQHNSSQLNHFYSKVSTYLNSLPSIEDDSDFTNLFARNKSSDILLCLDDNQTVHDHFLGARVSWLNQVDHDNEGKRTFVLTVKKKDRRRILRPYIQHIHTVSDEIEQNTRRERKLYLNTKPNDDYRGNRRWRSVPLTHPSTLDAMAMDSEIKNKVKSDLESFVKSKHYYHRMGRVWKRSYLLYGPSGTGKSSFIAAIASFLSYDVYDLDLYRVSDDSELKILLLQTTNKSVIVVEDLDRFLTDNSTAVSLSGILNFMDGLVSSCCGDERIFVFTANNKDAIDPALLRPGRIDVHIHFPLCNFNSFKSLASSYLGLKDHKLFPQLEGVFSTGAALSAAEISEIMIANRSSPTRALKTVITALNADVATKARRRSESASSNMSRVDEKAGGESGRWKEGITPPPVKELRTLYGLLRVKSSSSSNKIGPSDHDSTTGISKCMP